MFVLQPLPVLPSLPSLPSPPADSSDSNLSHSSLDHAPPPHLPPSQPLVSFFIQSFLTTCSRSNSTMPSLSRTRTILKFLTPKIRLTIPVPHLPSPSSPTSPGGNNTLFAPRAPTPLDSQSAKEKRDAALRERGLLPPLKQNKDLSRQELEEDKRLPIASPIEKTAAMITNPTGIEMVSAADLIKIEWEAKNRSGQDDERERFKSFKFGASLPLQESEAPQQQDIACQEIISPSFGRLGCSSDTPQIVVSGSAGRSQNSTERDHELGQLSPALIPLPPSPPPTPPASPKLGTNLELCAIDLCSPALVPLSPPSSESTAKHGADETNLELVIAIPTDPATPFLSLCPVTEELEPKEKDAQGHQRKVSVSDSQSSSLATPSLETPSHSTAMSILGTAESSPGVKTTMLIGGRIIPMIVESPIEEGPAAELAIPNTIPEDSDAEAQQNPLDDYQKPKPRRRKRTLLGQDPSKHLRVSASLTNMRRSVANTLSRTRSHLTVKGTKRDNTPDVPHIPLPPSPTFPLTSSTRRRSMEAAATCTPRQPVAPTLHNHGSILLETSAIEDDEARRMTELAFLG